MTKSCSMFAQFGAFHQDSPPCLGRGGKKMASAVPVLRLLHVHESDVGFVNQSGGLQSLAGLLLGHPLGRQLAQLLVDKRQQLTGRLRIALLDGGQDARDVVHGCFSPRPMGPAVP
jgi:hypothetical protein